jgi:predicted ATPase
LKTLLIQRTGGTPFFLEEGVRALVETKVLVGESGGYRLLKSLDAIEVPATVKALLAARIDRLTPEEKAVLQAASVVGTDVPLVVLQAIVDMPHDQLRRHLAQLQSSEFMYETNLFPEIEYTFKHALTHEVTYGSLLADRRRALHARIVDAIERLYADRLSEQIERLAHHAVRSEISPKAVAYLHEAGTKALMRSANTEAVTYFTQGLELAGKLATTPEQARQELRLLLALGPAFQMVKGFGSADVERTYARARQLGEQVGEPAELFQALWGLWLHTAAGKGRFREGRRIAEELVALAERLGDRVLLLEAHHAMAPSTLWVGEPETSRRHCEQGMAIYDRDQHRSLTFLYGGHDPGVCCRMHSSLALWLLGYPAASLERGRDGRALAQDLAHPASIINALPFAAIVSQLVGDVASLRDLADSMIALSTEHGFAQWLTFGRILDGWIQTEQGRGQPAIDQLRREIGEYRAMGNDLFVPCFLSLLVSAHLKQGAIGEGLAAVADALATGDATGSRLWDAEFHRLEGELLLARDPAAAPEAERAYRRAIELAHHHHTKAWELRAVTSLSRLWRRQGKGPEAARQLTEIYGWFTEGFDTADLTEARVLLDELGG